MLNTKTFVIILIFVLSAGCLISQEYKLSNPISPSENNLPEQSIGGFIGIGQNFQSGTHYVDCEGCLFEDGTGFGFTAGVIYQRKLIQNLSWGGYVTIDLMGISSSFVRKENVTFETTNNLPATANVDFRHTAEADFTYMGFAPFLSYNPFGFLTLRTAPRANFLLSSNVIHKKEAVNREINLGNTKGFLTTEDPVVQDSEFRDALSPVFGLDLSLLINFQVQDDSKLSLGYTQYLPFTETSDFGENFKINAWRFFVEFKYTIEEGYSNKPTDQ